MVGGRNLIRLVDFTDMDELAAASITLAADTIIFGACRFVDLVIVSALFFVNDLFGHFLLLEFRILLSFKPLRLISRRLHGIDNVLIEILKVSCISSIDLLIPYLNLASGCNHLGWSSLSLNKGPLPRFTSMTWLRMS